MRARRSREEWAAIIAAFEQSGLTAAKFCASRGLKPETLKWWRWRQRSRATERARDVRLVPVDLIDSTMAVAAPPPVVIAVAGVSVRVEIGTDTTYVAALVAELGRRC
jgi:hypothetical protein